MDIPGFELQLHFLWKFFPLVCPRDALIVDICCIDRSLHALVLGGLGPERRRGYCFGSGLADANIMWAEELDTIPGLWSKTEPSRLLAAAAPPAAAERF